MDLYEAHSQLTQIELFPSCSRGSGQAPGSA